MFCLRFMSSPDRGRGK